MFPLIKADIRKLFSVRSTYVILGLATILVSLISFYVYGYFASVEQEVVYAEAAVTAASTGATFLAIIAILLICHEYRYNTILYALTATNSRTKVMLSKVAVVTVFALVVTALLMALGVLAAFIGTQVKGLELAPQTFNTVDVAWRSLYYGLAWAYIGLVFGFIFRHVVGAIVALFMAPTIGEMLTFVLKDNVKYVPFNALDQIVLKAPDGLTAGSAVVLATAFIAACWLVAWWLFRERDAN
jgi:ABC-type transport system involved in multi-copper enzyme maturation permease subunit